MEVFFCAAVRSLPCFNTHTHTHECVHIGTHSGLSADMVLKVYGNRGSQVIGVGVVFVSASGENSSSGTSTTNTLTATLRGVCPCHTHMLAPMSPQSCKRHQF